MQFAGESSNIKEAAFESVFDAVGGRKSFVAPGSELGLWDHGESFCPFSLPLEASVVLKSANTLIQ